MCGIFGRLNHDGQRVGEEDLIRMSQVLKHRGPDDQRYQLFGSFGFGANRLSIIDVAGGHQPISNEDKTVWAVQNGEIYNYKELTRDLISRGHKFTTSSDTEILVHLYEEKGLDFAKELRGMFALAIWDVRHGRLILARDRIGIKPLYYYQDDKHFLFASELKALLTQKINKTINPVALHDYLSLNFVPGNKSILVGIDKLPPAMILVRSKRTTAISAYWELKTFLTSDTKATDENILISSLKEKLSDAVSSHLVSDVPLGIFLSGGLDSSAIVALATRFQNKVKTFSIGFLEKSYDELTFANKIARYFGTDHQDLIIKLQVPDFVEKMANFFDEPFADSSAVPTFAISEAAGKKVKVVLTGDGGDEVFGGYEIYKADKLLPFYQWLPVNTRRWLGKIAANLLPVSHKKMSTDLKIRRFLRGSVTDMVTAHFLWRAIFTEGEKHLLYQKTVHLRPTNHLFRELVQDVKKDDLLNVFLYLDTKISLVDDMLTKVDRMSMANSLEVRVPLLDHHLVEFMASLPSRYKVRGFNLKYLFKKALKEILPQEVLQRPKAGFHAPVPQWIKGDLHDMIHDYLSPVMLQSCGNLFQPQYVEQLLKEHERGVADWSRNIWGVFMFQLWYKRFMKTS